TDNPYGHKCETIVKEKIAKMQAAPPDAPGTADNDIAQAMQRYSQRTSQKFQPQRSGTAITCRSVDLHDPAVQQQVLIEIAMESITPSLQTAFSAVMSGQLPLGGGGAFGGFPGGGPGAP